MRRIWERLKAAWRWYWQDDQSDRDKNHLSQADKRFLLYGAFMICILTICVTSVLINQSNALANERNEKQITEMLNAIASYVASATDEEYEKVAKEIRHDFVFSTFHNDIESFINYIPNTADVCQADHEDNASPISLLCLNTGERYPLDTLGQQKESDEIYSYSRFHCAYDEVSETSVAILFSPDGKEASISFYRGSGVVSIQRMKEQFCDECIEDILKTVENKWMPEFVIFDSKAHVFHAVQEGTVSIGNCVLTTTLKDSGYNIHLVYGEES